MSKLTPQHYIESKDELAIAGFEAIKEKLTAKEPLTVGQVSADYKISVETVELVATTTSSSEYATIVRLESERAEYEAQLAEQRAKDAEADDQSNKKSVHPTVMLISYAIAIMLVIAVLLGLYALIAWIVGQL
jgi:uncharacterized Zn finger protein